MSLSFGKYFDQRSEWRRNVGLRNATIFSNCGYQYFSVSSSIEGSTVNGYNSHDIGAVASHVYWPE